MGAVLCMILILTSFNTERVHRRFVSACWRNFGTTFI